jgi:hypothetical protein
MSFATFDDLISGLCASTAQNISTYKVSQTAEGAGTYHSLWAASGNYPSAGTTPAAYGSAPSPDWRSTNATVGAIPFTNPGGSAESRLAAFGAVGTTVGRLILYDRLWACSGFSGTVTSAQTIYNASSYPVNRGAANGLGVEAWIEFYGAVGATTTTFTLSFRNTADATVSATYTHPANAESVGQIVPMIFPSGCTGVRYPISMTVGVTTTGAGNFGVTLLRRIAEVPLSIVNIGEMYDFAKLGFPKIETNACLALMVLCSATNTGNIRAQLNICEK